MHIAQSYPRILEVKLEYLGDIRVLVDLCLRCYSSMNSMIDRTERIASCYFTTDS